MCSTCYIDTCVALCVQFLPQDKVVGFARMKPGELLMESERAIGDARLHRLHHELIEDRNNLKTNERVSFAGAATSSFVHVIRRREALAAQLWPGKI